MSTFPTYWKIIGCSNKEITSELTTTGKPNSFYDKYLQIKRFVYFQLLLLFSFHNEELHSLYRSPNIVRVIKSRRLRWAGHVARIEEDKSSLKILTGKPTGKRHLGTPRRRWEDNIRMSIEEIGVSAGNWVDSAQDRNYWRALVNAALNLRVP